jgi:dephospho-CoA kinase
MLNVALTGNVAAGKSTVVDLFRGWGATIIDADELARLAQAPGGAVLAAIVRRFGATVLAPDGSLDRVALRSKVIGDQAALAALNAIVHPAVRQRRENLLREDRERGDVLVVNDIPLLFEALDPAQFAAVVLVDAPPAVRRARLRAARGFTSAEADRMMAVQMPSQRKRSRSHFVIDNDGSLADLEAKARAVFEELRRRAALAALGRPARSLLLAAEGSEHPALRALADRYADAGLRVRRAATDAAVRKALQRGAARPDAIVATGAAAAATEQAWERAGKPAVLVLLTDDPDPVAVRLDLRPWGYDSRLKLGEPGVAGVAPRPDLFPHASALARTPWVDTGLGPR